MANYVCVCRQRHLADRLLPVSLSPRDIAGDCTKLMNSHVYLLLVLIIKVPQVVMLAAPAYLTELALVSRLVA